MAAIIRAALVFLVASAALADTIRFVPPNPTTNTSVDVVVRGSTGGCPARQLGTSTSGSTITLRLNFDPPPNAGCTGALLPYTATFHLGILPAGVKTVVAVQESASSSPRELARKTLIVRDDALGLHPYAVPLTGGLVIIDNPPAGTPNSVTVDGVTVPAVGTVQGWAFEAPPHAAGPAAVTVNLAGGGSVSAPFSLVYYEPGSIDPALFEPVLFPLSYEGPGAFGSQWTTESYISEPNSTKRIMNDNQPWGRVLYLVRGTTDHTFFASRIRDLSRQAQSAGVEIPVVRERDFRLGPIDLLNVPNDARFRAMIRIWTMEDQGMLGVAIGDAVKPIATTPIPGTALAFASFDITGMLRGVPASPVRVFGINGSAPQPYIFALISITNNETQEVTIISSR